MLTRVVTSPYLGCKISEQIIVIGFAPGGSADSAARGIAKKLSEDLGQNVIVDNKPGAGGNIAHAYTATAPADGSVILFGSIGPLALRSPRKILGRLRLPLQAVDPPPTSKANS